MTREDVARIVAWAEQPYRYGMWSEFARNTGLSPYAILWWRKKLGYQLRPYPRPDPMHSVPQG